MPDTLTIRLGTEMAAALERTAREMGVSKGEIVRQALAARLRQNPQFTVLPRYIGAIDGPADLSTSKAYRRAWRKRLA
jgi:hypothetical protein